MLLLTVSAGIKRPHFCRFCRQRRHRRARVSMVNGTRFLLTGDAEWCTIIDSRRSGGDRWRAAPRNNRLDSSRTMQGCGTSRTPQEKHIGPIDPDASTLNQTLNHVCMRPLLTFSLTKVRALPGSRAHYDLVRLSRITWLKTKPAHDALPVSGHTTGECSDGTTRWVDQFAGSQGTLVLSRLFLRLRGAGGWATG